MGSRAIKGFLCHTQGLYTKSSKSEPLSSVITDLKEFDIGGTRTNHCVSKVDDNRVTFVISIADTDRSKANSDQRGIACEPHSPWFAVSVSDCRTDSQDTRCASETDCCGDSNEHEPSYDSAR